MAEADEAEREGRVPIIRLWGVLLVPLQGDVSDRQVAALTEGVLREIRRGDCTGVAIDLSGLWLVDSHLCAAFADLAAAAKYMGAQTVLCGLSPEIAATLQTMGFDLRGVKTVLTLEHALMLLGISPPASRARSRERAAAAALADQMLQRNPAPAEVVSNTGGSA